MKRAGIIVGVLTALLVVSSCFSCKPRQARPVELVVLDPGHFHAALVLKNRLEGVSETVRVYAPEGAEVNQFLVAVDSYNNRPENPTSWKKEVCLGDDYLERVISDGRGDVVVLAGNNRKKTGYILESVKAGYSVLSDKPMAINKNDFGMLAEAYRLADGNGLLIRDIMTERYDILNVVARELLRDPAIFGDLLPGSEEAPSVTMRSVHHFFKTVSGQPLIRPAWYYDVEQQGEGLADVTTHMIDIVAWLCFPDEPVRYTSDVEVLAAGHWPTSISPAEFFRSTDVGPFPQFLDKYVKDGALEVMANGSMVYRVKGIHVGMEVVWNYASPAGGDTSSAVIKGSKASLEFLQNEETGFIKQLFVRRSQDTDTADFEKRLQEKAGELRETYPLLTVEQRDADLYLIGIPVEERAGHEAHFSLVAEIFLQDLHGKNTPEWEKENTLSKYYITTTAVEMANKAK